MFTTTDRQILTAVSSLESAATWASTDGLRYSRRAVEASAEAFNDALINSMLSAIESGIIVRSWCTDIQNWWASKGEGYAWTAIRVSALILFTIACFACVVGFAVSAAYKWCRGHGAPMALTAADVICRFLLCYEEPPALAESELDRELAELAALEAVAEGQVVWAAQRWPQLAA